MLNAEPHAGERAERTAAQFATTHWTVVVAAAGAESKEGAAALEALCGQYWYPLYAFARRQGQAPADAEDLVQSFFVALLAKESLQRADPSRGRFRTFLLACLKHFMAKEWQRRQAVKRGGGVSLLSTDELGPEELYARETAHTLTPEQLYDRTWAWRILERVRNRLQADYAQRGQADRFALLERFLPGDTCELTYVEAARQLGLSEGSIKAEVHRLKRRYRVQLRTAISPTVAGLEDVDDELRALIAALER